jgi:FkbH-like protein
MYAEEAQRRQFKSSSGDIRDYLHGLNIELRFEPFDASKHVARAAQLTQKTNQFNLATRRYTEADLVTLREAGAHIYLASLQDRFGDYGRVVMVILKPASEAGTCLLDVFLMSCRVIGRGVEESFLHMAAEKMKVAGFTKLRAEFIPTAKNAVSAGFLASAGLTETRRDADGRIEYELDLTKPIAGPAEWLRVTSSE